MSFVQKLAQRFSYPARAPFTSITLYYAGLFLLWAVLLWLVPPLREAFTGERLASLASETLSLGADAARGAPMTAAWLSWRFALLLGLAMVGAFLLMLPSSWVYMATRRKKGFNQDVVHTMVILALAVAGVVVIVRNSLALAFSLAGIVGAVRFRNSLPDTRDTLYIFLAIGVGLAAGVEALPAAAVLSLVFNYVVLAMWRADYGMCELGRPAGHLLLQSPAGAPAADGAGASDGKANGKRHGGKKKPFDSVLVVRARGTETARHLVEPFLARETRRWELADVEANPRAEESVLRYRVRLGRHITAQDVEDALLEIGDKNLLGARIH